VALFATEKSTDYNFLDIGEVWQALATVFPAFANVELIKPFANAMISHNINMPCELDVVLRDTVDRIIEQTVCVLHNILLSLAWFFTHVFSTGADRCQGER
jgi:hypothetical protein